MSKQLNFFPSGLELLNIPLDLDFHKGFKDFNKSSARIKFKRDIFSSLCIFSDQKMKSILKIVPDLWLYFCLFWTLSSMVWVGYTHFSRQDFRCALANSWTFTYRLRTFFLTITWIFQNQNITKIWLPDISYILPMAKWRGLVNFLSLMPSQL